MSDAITLLASFAELARQVLGAPLVFLEKDLKTSMALGWPALPKPVAASYDSLLFGGSLLSCEPGRITEYTEAFHTRFAALALRDDAGYAVLGPYLPDSAGDFSVDLLLSESGVAPGSRAEYLEMYENLPALGEDKIRPFFRSLSLAAHGAPISSLPFSAVDLVDEPPPCPVYEEDKLQAQAEMLEHRYTQERNMMECVARGDYEALGYFLNASLSLARTPNKLRNDKNFLIILNTLLRKSIESAQVHPLYIDRISTRYAIRIEQLTPRDSTTAFKREMLRDYCDLVRARSLARYSPNVRDAINFIHFNLTEPLTLTAIARKTGANPTYLSTQFNRELGTSITDYISDRRVAESKPYLRAGTLSIAQVAATVGFADVNYFSRVFKQKTGVTPSAYRAGSAAR